MVDTGCSNVEFTRTVPRKNCAVNLCAFSGIRLRYKIEPVDLAPCQVTHCTEHKLVREFSRFCDHDRYATFYQGLCIQQFYKPHTDLADMRAFGQSHFGISHNDAVKSLHGISADSLHIGLLLAASPNRAVSSVVRESQDNFAFCSALD